MLKRKYIILLVILALGLITSGCADNTAQENETTDEAASASEVKDNNTSLADEALSEEMVGITEPEITDIEEEVDEIEEMINETDNEEEIAVEEI